MDRIIPLSIIAAVFTAAVAARNCQGEINSVKEGADYLSKKGYTNIQGGERDYFNSCHRGILAGGLTNPSTKEYKSVFAREYSVTTPSGEEKKKVVCFGLLGKYEPPLGY